MLIPQIAIWSVVILLFCILTFFVVNMFTSNKSVTKPNWSKYKPKIPNISRPKWPTFSRPKLPNLNLPKLKSAKQKQQVSTPIPPPFGQLQQPRIGELIKTETEPETSSVPVQPQNVQTENIPQIQIEPELFPPVDDDDENVDDENADDDEADYMDYDDDVTVLTGADKYFFIEE